MTSEQIKRQEERRSMMVNSRMYQVIPKMAAPTILCFLIMTLYNLTDTFFVSKLGTAATGAVGVNFSLMGIIQTAGMAFGVGAGSYISRLLGAREGEKASRVVSTAFFLSISLGIIIMVLGLVFVRPLVVFLGATETIVPYAIDYASYILYGAPFMCGVFVMNQSLRAEGSAVFSMLGTLSGAFINLALDPLFIFTLDMGVAGAAIATCISKVITFFILLYPYTRKRGLLQIKTSLFTPTRDILSEIARMGFPTLMLTGLMTISSIVINNVSATFGDSAIAAMSIVNRSMRFFTSFLMGYGQGFQPVAGYNWGAERYDRVLKAFRFTTVTGVTGISAICGIVSIFAPLVMGFFTKDDLEIIRIGALSIRSQCYSMPFYAFTVIANSLFTALGRAKSAGLISASRQGIFLIPLIYLLPVYLGVTGLAYAQAVSDIFTFLLALPLSVFILKELNQLLKNMPAIEGQGTPVMDQASIELEHAAGIIEE
jgi:putative MATE family efflux protein